ncbi:MAG: exodeoxyribonuclease VII large subunit, partial [Opitutales bacterium]
RLEALEKRLHANSLSTTLKRGFSYLSDKDGNLINSVTKLEAGKKINVHLQDGRKLAEVQSEDRDLN